MNPKSQEELAFPKLTETHLGLLKSCSTVKTFPAGTYCYRQGQSGYGLMVVTKGFLGVYEDSRGKSFKVAEHQVGEFAGDIDLLTGRPSLVDMKAEVECEVLEIDRPCLRNIISQSPELGEIFLRAFLMRRELLLKQGYVGVKIIGSKWSADTVRLISFLIKNRIPYSWVDLETSVGVDGVLTDLGLCVDDTPVVILKSFHILKNPTDQELADVLEIANVNTEEIFDLIIVGAGPAGLASAVYGASEGLKTLVIDANAIGGQAATSSKIENYLGFPYGISGQDLANKALLQAEKFGVTFASPRAAKKLEKSGSIYSISLDNDQKINARSVIISSGIQYKRLPLENLQRFENAGIFYGATKTEASFCQNEEVAVIGGGNSAGQATVFLASHAKKVYLVIRGNDLNKSMSKYLVNRIENLKNVELLKESEVVKLEGEKRLEQITIRTGAAKKDTIYPVKNLFIFIGAIPCTEWLKGTLALDEKGFLRTGSAFSQADLKNFGWSLERAPGLLETCLPAVFAAGDVRAGSMKRVTTSVGEGAMAVSLVHQALSNLN